MFMPKLLNEAKKKRRLIGLSKPLARRKVDRMKRMPRREKMDVTLSVIIIALTWLGVASTPMMGGRLLGQRERLRASTQRDTRRRRGGMQALYSRESKVEKADDGG